MERNELGLYLNNLLQVSQFGDYCPNGLQVEGRRRIEKIVTGVTASLELIERAADAEADAILVHHGYFWRGEDAAITGTKQRRLRALLTRDINLFAYHLPLDDHPELGNNARFGARFGWIGNARFGERNLAWGATLPISLTLEALARQIENTLGRTPLVVGIPEAPIRRIGWCTGAAQNYLGAAIDAGVDVFISGEISESTYHLAQESGVGYISAGHHASERYGVQAVGEHLSEKFGLRHEYIDVPNPV